MMKTSKAALPEMSLSRRAQPLRQTRNNPPRSSISGTRNFGSRGSLGGGGMEEAPIEIFPAITHLADAITALPKEIVRHFTLLKEVDAKIFAPEDDLTRLVEAALSAPLPQRQQTVEIQAAIGPTSASMSAQESLNGSTNGQLGLANSAPEPDVVWDPGNIPRRQLFKHCAYTMQNMLVSLDEKNHVIATAGEALNKQLARIDDCFPFIELEISEEARYGSTTHWAYPENRLPKPNVSRREIASANNLSAAAHLAADEAAARSDARKQALLERKKGKQQIESDFDDHDIRNKDKRLHGNSKVRKVADTSSGVGLGVTNGGAANGNPPKRRKVDKGPAGGAVMERSMSGVFGSNGTASKGKVASPRSTPQPEGAKKRSRAPAAANGQTRKRNNTLTSAAMSPSIASSPIRSTFPDSKLTGKASPPPPNGRPASIRARQNSTQSNVEKRPTSAASNKPNGNGTSTPDLAAASVVIGRSVAEVKSTMKESLTSSKERLLEDIDTEDPHVVGGVVVGNRKDANVPAKSVEREETNGNGNSLPPLPTQVITTKSGRASKPSTPAISSFPEPPARSRSSRSIETISTSNKRSHKKGAGAAAQQALANANQNLPMDVDDNASKGDEGEDEEAEEADENEPRYCYCNNISYGEMVACDNEACVKEWFHLDCVGLKTAPKGNTKWYCDDCKEKMLKNKRFNGR